MNITDHQIKILILFTLQSAGCPLPEETLLDVLGLCDINCLNIQQNMVELTEEKHILKLFDEGKYFISPSDTGIVISNTLKQEIPYTIREKAASITASKIADLCRKLQYKSDIEECSDSDGLPYCVKLSMSDDSMNLLDINLYTPTKFQAELISRNFIKCPTKIYKTILSSLTEEKI